MTQSEYVLTAHRSMVDADLTGGILTLAGADYPCTVGSVERTQTMRPDGGGFSPMLVSQVSIERAVLPSTSQLKRGQHVIVTPTSGPPHSGQIFSLVDTGPFVTVTVHDVNQMA